MMSKNIYIHITFEFINDIEVLIHGYRQGEASYKS